MSTIATLPRRLVHAPLRVAAALAVIAELQACTSLAVTGPPAGGYQQPKDVGCTQSPAAPIIDTVAAVPLLAVGTALLVGAASVCEHCSGGLGTTGAGLALAVPGALSAGSAVYGYSETASCREAVRALAAQDERLGNASGGASPGLQASVGTEIRVE